MLWYRRERKRNDVERDEVRVRQGDVGGRRSIQRIAAGNQRSKVVNECVDSGVRQSAAPSGK